MLVAKALGNHFSEFLALIRKCGKMGSLCSCAPSIKFNNLHLDQPPFCLNIQISCLAHKVMHPTFFAVSNSIEYMKVYID